MRHSLVLGSRNSLMAKMVAEHVRTLLLSRYPDMGIELRHFSSEGDRNQGDLSKAGGKGAFVKDLELKLLAREVDCAVHALKDVPGDVDPHPELELACYLDREDPRDCLVMRPGQSVPATGEGLTLATSSPRRRAFLKQLYPGATLIPLRGNVDTRLRKLQAGEFDGMVLSLAGLQRLDLDHHVTKIYEPEEMLPAVGQGVLCLQVRKADVAKCGFLEALHSATHGQSVAAERAMLHRLQGNCHAAIAGYCLEEGGKRRLRGWVSDPDGRGVITADLSQPVEADPDELGMAVADALLSQGARRLICGEETCAG